MKTYKHLWEDLVSDQNIATAIHRAGLGNKDKRTKLKLRRMEENKEKYIPYFKNYAEHFKNAKHEPVEIYDGISRKKRTIIVPTPREQVIHHMVVGVLKPIFMKSMYQHSYGSVPGRGPHKAKRQLEKWLPSKYVLKIDVHHYFDSVNQNILIRKLERIIKDEKFMNLLKEIISVLDHGIPLGFYTSQWFANFYLTDLDHYITSELGFGKMQRYMDDIVVLDNSKKKLHKLLKKIEAYLKKLDLQLKANWQVFRFDYFSNGQRKGRFIDFMGFRFYRDKTTLRRSIMLKATRKAKRISKKSKVTWYDASQMLSYTGYFRCTDTRGCFDKYISSKVNIRRLKRKVSKHSKCLMKSA